MRKIVVIPNAIDASRFAGADPSARQELEALFPRPRRWIVGAAGRLSPEKGFSVLVDAAERVTLSLPDAGFVLFGEGVLRPALTQQISARGLSDRFLLAGFRSDLDRLLPGLDLLVQSSFTEGMPNAVLEACAAGIPVVATAVGGTPEILEEPTSDLLVPPGDPEALAERICSVLANDQRRIELAERAREHVLSRFTFTAQAELYRNLFGELIGVAEPESDGTVLAPESRKPLAGAVDR